MFPTANLSFPRAYDGPKYGYFWYIEGSFDSTCSKPCKSSQVNEKCKKVILLLYLKIGFGKNT